MAFTNLAETNEFLTNQLSEFGIDFVSSLYRDIQGKTMTFQLFNSNSQVVETFVFPINPETVTHQDISVSTIKKTSAGVVVHKNASFVPKEIQMNGSFGRSLKLVLNEKPLELFGFSFNLTNKKLSFNADKPELSSFAKTGFGCLQILRDMFEKSNTLDNSGKPHFLVGYFGMLSETYIVEIKNITQNHNIETNNFLPGYSMELVALARYSQNLFSNADNLLENISRTGVEVGANLITRNISSLF